MNVEPIPDRSPWTDGELATLRQLVSLELPMRYIARKMHRSEESVRLKAHDVGMAAMLHRPFTPHRSGAWLLRH